MGYSIAIEGIDGAGKYTVCETLKKLIEIYTKEVYLISFPQHGEISGLLVDNFLYRDLKFTGDRIHKSLVESLLYSIDRLVTLNKFNEDIQMSFIDKYKDDIVLIFDRYTYSNLIHRSNEMSKSEFLDFSEKMQKIEFQQMEIIEPNKVFLLNINPETAYKNIEKRGREKDQNEDFDNLKKSSANIQKVNNVLYNSIIINIDSDKNESGMLTTEEIAMKIFKELLKDKKFLDIVDLSKIFDILDILNKKERK